MPIIGNCNRDRGGGPTLSMIIRIHWTQSREVITVNDLIRQRSKSPAIRRRYANDSTKQH